MNIKPENKFFSFMSLIGDLIFLNILFLITSIPILTFGASYCALYISVKKRISSEESYLIKDYWKALKENLKNAACIWAVLLLFLLAMLAFSQYIAAHLDNIAALVLYCLLFVWISFTLLYAFPLQATFINTPINILKNSLLTALRHLPWTLLLFFTAYVPPALTLAFPSAFYFTAVYWLLIGFSVSVLCTVCITNKVFAYYISK